jgi:O-antigen ligase
MERLRQAVASAQLRGVGGGLCVLGLLSYPLPTAWLGLVVLVALTAARWYRWGRPFPATPYNVPIGLYAAGALVGLYATVRGWEFAEIRLFGLLAAGAAFFLLVDGVTSLRAAQRVIYVSLAVTAVVLLPLPIVTAPVLQIPRLPQPLMLPLSAIIPLAEPWRMAVMEDGTLGQRFRLYGSGLGTLAAWGGALALGPLLYGQTTRARVLGTLAAVYCTLFMMISASRGTLLTALAGVLLTLCIVDTRQHQRHLRFAGMLLAAGAAVLIAVPHLPAQMKQSLSFVGEAIDPGPLHVRLEVWQNTLFLLGDFSLTGVGLGLRSGVTVYKDYFLFSDPSYAHAHNILLQSYVEQGILGLLGLVGLLGVALVGARRMLRHSRDPEFRLVIVAASGALLVLVLRGLTDILAVTTVGMVLLFGSLGLLAAVIRLTTDQERASQAPPTPPSLDRDGRPVRRLLLVPLGLSCLAVLWLLHPGLRGLLPTEVKQAGRAAAASVYLNLGLLEVEKARFAEERLVSKHLAAAEPLLERAAELAPGNLAVERGLAAAAAIGSRTAEAQRVLERIRGRLSPDDSVMWFQVGRLYRQAGNVEAAIVAWSRTEPSVGTWSCSSPDYQLVDWGRDLAGRRQFETAAKTYHAAIKIRPTEPARYRLLSEAMVAAVVAAENDLEKGLFLAREHMQALAREHPDVPWGYLEAARLYQETGREDLARRWTERAESIWSLPAWSAVHDRAQRVRSCESFPRSQFSSQG